MTMHTHCTASSGRRFPGADRTHSGFTASLWNGSPAAEPAANESRRWRRRAPRLHRTVLEEVRTARDRLDAGLYGTCAGRGREMPQTRLELLPWATTCVVCGSLTGARSLDSRRGRRHAGARPESTRSWRASTT